MNDDAKPSRIKIIEELDLYRRLRFYQQLSMVLGIFGAFWFVVAMFFPR